MALTYYLYKNKLTKQNAKPYKSALLFITIMRIDTKQTQAHDLQLLTNNIH